MHVGRCSGWLLGVVLLLLPVSTPEAVQQDPSRQGLAARRGRLDERTLLDARANQYDEREDAGRCLEQAARRRLDARDAGGQERRVDPAGRRVGPRPERQDRRDDLDVAVRETGGGLDRRWGAAVADGIDRRRSAAEYCRRGVRRGPGVRRSARWTTGRAPGGDRRDGVGDAAWRHAAQEGREHRGRADLCRRDRSGRRRQRRLGASRSCGRRRRQDRQEAVDVLHGTRSG